MARVRTSTVKSTLANKDIQAMFGQVLGDDASLDLSVAWPKFKRVRFHAARFVKLLEWLGAQDWLQEHFGAEAARIAAFAAQLAAEHQRVFRGVPDLDRDAVEWAVRAQDRVAQQVMGPLYDPATPEAVVLEFTGALQYAPAESVAAFQAGYKAAVESDLVNTAVQTCSNMAGVQAQLADPLHLAARFLLGAGLAFAPIPALPAANFMAFYQQSAYGPERRQRLLMFLHKLHGVTHEVYEAASAPDVDIEQFVTIVIDSLGEVKKQIPRCNEAFGRLEASVALLRSNFGRYYKDTKHSGNPTMLMENFVLDVAQGSEGASLKVRQQFKRIITHYQKMAAQQPRNPQTDMIFAEVNKNFEALQRHDAGEAEEAEPDPEEAAAAEAALYAAEAQARETEFSARAAAAGREMSASERAAHKHERERRRRLRTAGRRKAQESIDKHLATVPVFGLERPSDLSRELDAEARAPASEGRRGRVQPAAASAEFPHLRRDRAAWAEEACINAPGAEDAEAPEDAEESVAEAVPRGGAASTFEVPLRENAADCEPQADAFWHAAPPAGLAQLCGLHFRAEGAAPAEDAGAAPAEGAGAAPAEDAEEAPCEDGGAQAAAELEEGARAVALLNGIAGKTSTS